MSLTTRALWSDTAPASTPRPAPTSDVEAEVVVVGSGITGLTTALLLAQAGKDVVVLERDVVANGVTTATTAKVSVLHGLVYDELSRLHSPKVARAYAEANTAGLERVVRWAEELQIVCALERDDAYTYVEDARERPRIEREVEAARRAGLDASLVTDTPLPFEVAAAIRVPGQVVFDSRAYALGLARAVEAAGGRIHERAAVRSLRERGSRPSVKLDDGTRVTGEHLVIATHVPIFDRGLFFARLGARRSYAIALSDVEHLPTGMHWGADEPSRSIRRHVDPESSRSWLIVGGEGHTAGADRDTRRRYAALEHFARERFGGSEVTHRWSSQDLVSIDGLPYVGPLHPGTKRVWTATGYRKWGLTNGSVAGEVLAARILGSEHPWAPVVDTSRLPPVSALPRAAKENASTGVFMVGDWLRTPGAPICTHLGCKLRHNTAEQSWDCPCHGSRFSCEDGRVLEGPATRPLTPEAAKAPTS